MSCSSSVPESMNLGGAELVVGRTTLSLAEYAGGGGCSALSGTNIAAPTPPTSTRSRTHRLLAHPPRAAAALVGASAQSAGVPLYSTSGLNW